MAHQINGLIAKNSVLNGFSSQFELHKPIELPQGYGFLPLNDEHLDEIIELPFGEVDEGFIYLSSNLKALLSIYSQKSDDISYIETEYFGGYGTQAAVIFSNGLVTYQQNGEEYFINEALSQIGVVVTEQAVDEFESIYLHTQRNNEGWFDLAGEKATLDDYHQSNISPSKKGILGFILKILGKA